MKKFILRASKESVNDFATPLKAGDLKTVCTICFWLPDKGRAAHVRIFVTTANQVPYFVFKLSDDKWGGFSDRANNLTEVLTLICKQMTFDIHDVEIMQPEGRIDNLYSERYKASQYLQNIKDTINNQHRVDGYQPQKIRAFLDDLEKFGYMGQAANSDNVAELFKDAKRVYQKLSVSQTVAHATTYTPALNKTKVASSISLPDPQRVEAFNREMKTMQDSVNHVTGTFMNARQKTETVYLVPVRKRTLISEQFFPQLINLLEGPRNFQGLTPDQFNDCLKNWIWENRDWLQELASFKHTESSVPANRKQEAHAKLQEALGYIDAQTATQNRQRVS